MSAVTILAELLSRYRFEALLKEQQDRAGLEELVSLGLVTKGRSVSSIMCSACDAQHSAQIVADSHSDRIGWHCPEVGFIPIDASELQAVSAMPQRLVELMAESMECKKRRRQALKDDLLWRVGLIDLPRDSVTVYFAVRLNDAADAREIGGRIRAEAGVENGLIIVPRFDDGTRFLVERCQIAALEDLVTISSARIVIDKNRVAAAAGIQFKRLHGRPLSDARSRIDEFLSRWAQEDKVFTSQRELTKAIGAEFSKRGVIEKPPGRTLIIERLQALNLGRLVVGK